MQLYYVENRQLKEILKKQTNKKQSRQIIT